MEGSEGDFSASGAPPSTCVATPAAGHALMAFVDPFSDGVTAGLVLTSETSSPQAPVPSPTLAISADIHARSRTEKVRLDTYSKLSVSPLPLSAAPFSPDSAPRFHATDTVLVSPAESVQLLDLLSPSSQFPGRCVSPDPTPDLDSKPSDSVEFSSERTSIDDSRRRFQHLRRLRTLSDDGERQIDRSLEMTDSRTIRDWIRWKSEAETENLVRDLRPP